MNFMIFVALMCVTAGVVLRFGGREERAVLLVLFSAYILTGLTYHLGGGDWLDPQIGILLVDLVALGVLILIALRSDKFWTLAIIPFHAIPVLVQATKVLVPDLDPYGIGVLQGLWSYPQMAILCWAAVRNWKRQQLYKRMSSTFPN